jgi:peptide/nickel transport system permease protein
VFQYLIRRLLWAIVLFIAVTLVTYVIFFITPSDPARLAAGQGATPADVQKVAERLHLDEPIYQQYARFLWELVGHQSLGTSFVNRQDVNDIVVRSAPVTASLVFGGAIMWLLVSIPIGIISALRPRSLIDRAGMVFVLIGLSAHPVWIGLILAYFIGFKLGWTPITGYADFFNPTTEAGGPVQWAYHMILPWMTFALLFSALYVRLIRANVMETMNEDYVRTARAKGASERVVLFRHALRNALIPVTTVAGLIAGFLVAGAVIIESVFRLPGVGQLVYDSINNRDLIVIKNVVILFTILVLTVNLLVDMAYALLDPRPKVRA